jgi:hypothetical protein
MDAIFQLMRYFTGRASNSNTNRTNPEEYATSWGPFRPTYYTFPFRKPLGDVEAQKLVFPCPECNNVDRLGCV